MPCTPAQTCLDSIRRRLSLIQTAKTPHDWRLIDAFGREMREHANEAELEVAQLEVEIAKLQADKEAVAS